jgi:hypothetical protein
MICEPFDFVELCVGTLNRDHTHLEAGVFLDRGELGKNDMGSYGTA